jgi:hypothetical protein
MRGWNKQREAKHGKNSRRIMRTVYQIARNNAVILCGEKKVAYTKSTNLRVKRSMKIKQKPGEKRK